MGSAGSISITVPIAVGSISSSGARLLFADLGGTASIGGAYVNGGELHVDDAGGQGKSVLAIAGTLTNTNYLAIGNSNASGSTMVTAAALSNSGTINLGSSLPNLATLGIAGAAGFGTAGVLTGSVSLAGNALLSFGSGQITTIAGTLALDGTHAFVADAGDATHNSALTGLNSITGRLYLRNGASVAPGGNLAVNGGELHVDDSGGQGGTTLAIPGTLSNTNYLAIGNSNASGSTTVTAAALSNAGTINLGSNLPNLATLSIAGAAGFGTAGVLTGSVSLAGNALLSFGSGQITTIAGTLALDGTHAFVADAGDATHNSALAGLNSITGRLYLRNGASVAPGGNLAVNGGELHVDDSGGQGGTTLAIPGTLSNTNYLAIGNSNASGSTTVTAAALSNSGTINLGSNLPNLATLSIAGAAGFGTAGVLTGSVSLAGNALLSFGSGQITTIAGTLALDGTHAFVADAGDAAHNSALAGLNSITGRLYLRNGASVAPGGNLAVNGGELHVDDSGGQGGTTLAIPGTLSNTNYLAIGNSNASGSTTVTAAALSNSGTINLGSNLPNLATLSIAGAAGFGTAGVLTGSVSLAGNALLSFGSGQITTIAGTLALDGTHAFVADAGDATHNSALTGLNSITGRLYLRNGASVAPGGNLAVNGGELHVDDSGGQGGTTLAIPGTLSNTNYLAIGNSNASGSTTVTAAALSNSGTINLGSNLPNLATLSIAGATGFGTAGVLTGSVSLAGNALLSFGSGQITTIAGTLALDGTHAFVADAGDATHNSALTGLSSITGRLYLRNGASVAPGGNLAVNGGELHVDDSGGQGGTTLAIAGTLSNTNYLAIGNSNASGSTTVTAAALSNSGTINLGSNLPNLATLSVSGPAANSGNFTIANSANLVVGVGSAFAQNAGTTMLSATLTGNLDVNGGKFYGSGTVTGDVDLNGGFLFAGAGSSSPGTLTIQGSLTENSKGAIEIPIFGLSPGQIGTISVAGGGDVVLQGGALQVDVGGVTFTPGQTFTILTFAPGSLTGTFGSVQVGASVGSGAGVDIGGNLALAVDYDNAAGDIQLKVVYEPYESFYRAATAFGPDVANGASAAQLAADALSTETLAVSGALGTLGGQSWQVAYDKAATTVSTLASHIAGSASATQIFQDTMALDASLVAGLIGSVAGHAAQTAYDGISQLAGTLGQHIANAATGSQIQSDLSALYSALAGSALGTLPWQQAVSASMASAQTLSADIANHASTAQLESDAGALFGTIVSGSLNAIGGSTLQQAYAAGGATIAKLAADIAGGTSGAQLFADVNSLFSAIAPVVAGQTAGKGALDGFQSVTTAASTIGADLLKGATTVQLLADELQLLGAVSGARIGEVAGDAAEQAFNQIVKDIGSFQAGFVKSSSAGQVGADASSLASTTIQSTLNVLGPAGLGDANRSMTQASDALLADLRALHVAIANGGVLDQALMDKIAADRAILDQAVSSSMDLAASGSQAGGGLPAAPAAFGAMAAALPGNPNQTLDNAYGWKPDLSGILGTEQPAIERNHPDLEQVGDYLKGLNDVINNDQGVLVNQRNAGDFAGADATSNRLQQEISNQAYWSQYYANGAAGGPAQAKAWQKLDADLRHSDWKDVPKEAWDYYKSWKSFFKDPLKKMEDLAKKYDMNEFWNAFKHFGHMNGDVHLTTFDGVHYDFQAIGEFTASRSTLPGDSFDVQIRLEPWFSGSSVSVMTQVAASIGGDRVTFDLHRSDMVWVNGHATSFSSSNPTLALAGGQLVELSPGQFELDWNTGESLKVSNSGSFLNVDMGVGTGVQGLLGSNAGAASTFQLPDGTVLSQPLSLQQLYTTFGNAWRITQQESLFDYQAGQTTATFTKLDFPQAFVAVQTLPAPLLNAAGNAVFAAGITDPNMAADAILDFAATGDLSFVDAAAQVDQQVSVTKAANVTATAGVAALGVMPVHSTVPTVSGHPTEVTFEVYATGVLGAPATVSWTVASPGAGYFSAAAFGGALPSGQATLAAGQNMADFTVTLPANALGAMASEGLAVTIGTAGGIPVFAPMAQTKITQAFGIYSVSATTSDGSTHVATGDVVTIWVLVTDPVGVSGTPTLQLSDNEVATYVAGSGSTTLTFAYVVHRGDQATDLAVTALNLGAGDAIKAADGTSLVGSISADLGIVVDTQTSVSVAALSAVKPEGNSGTTAFTFTVSLNQSDHAGHSVSWAVVGSGAHPASATDFVGNVLPSGVVSFAAGETSKTVTVNVAGDTAVEPDNGFVVTLSTPSAGLTLGTASASGTILNDDLKAHDDAYVVLQGHSLSAAASVGVLANDDVTPPVTAALQTGVGHGQLQLATDGSLSYAPTAGFAGVDSFIYHATGANGAADDGHVVIYVVPVQVGASTTLNLLALNAEQQIASTYAAFFGRGADAAGFEFWVNQFNAGLQTQGPATLFANIASSFGISQEAKALYPFLVNPFGAGDGQINTFLDSVYNNLFNRSSDAAGLAYWTGQIKQTLQSGKFVGSVLIDIMSGAQDTAAGNDITTLMAKVAVGLAYVHDQQEHGTNWAGASDAAAATALLDAVTDAPQTILAGIRNADMLIANHV